MVSLGGFVRSVFRRRGGLVGCISHTTQGAQTLALRTVAFTREERRPIAVVDLGADFGPLALRRAGVPPDELYLAQPCNIVEAFELCGALVRSRSFGAVVLDAAVPIAEACEGLQAEWGRKEDDAIRRLAEATRSSPTPCVMTVLSPDRPGIVFESPAGRRGMRALRRVICRTVRGGSDYETD